MFVSLFFPLLCECISLFPLLFYVKKKKLNGVDDVVGTANETQRN